MMRAAISGLMMLCLSGCDAGSPVPPATQSSGQPNRPDHFDIKPADFAVSPCGEADTVLCLLVYAGGKRLLFGMPAGVADRIGDGDLLSLDGLFLVSLRPEAVEGLDEIRNRSWRAGRADRLSIIGPGGLAGLVDGLNLAYEISDALVVVEDGAPPGGFDAALLETGLEVEREQIVFDTGDVKVRAVSGGTGRATYRVTYRDIDGVWHDLLIRPCGGVEIGFSDYPTRPEHRTQIACETGSFGASWPLKGTMFMVKSQR